MHISASGVAAAVNSLTSRIASSERPWWQAVLPGWLDEAKGFQNLIAKATCISKSHSENAITSMPNRAPIPVTHSCKRTQQESNAVIIHHIYYYSSLKTLRIHESSRATAQARLQKVASLKI